MDSIGRPIGVLEKEKDFKKQTKTFVDDFYSMFATLHCYQRLNISLFYGRDEVKCLFQSNSKVISPVARQHLQELKSWIINNFKTPSVFFTNNSNNERLTSIINEILLNAYSESKIKRSIMEAWENQMVTGIGILKVRDNASSKNLFLHSSVSPLNCIFDYTNPNQPSFFIEENILSTVECVSLYGLNEDELKEILGKPTMPKILQDSNVFAEELGKYFSAGSGDNKKEKQLKDIYSTTFAERIVKEKPSLSFNTVREEYRVANSKIDGKIKRMYQRVVYVNNFAVSTEYLPDEQFPYFIMHDYKNDSRIPLYSYPSWMCQARADVLNYNHLFNIQIDTAVNSAAASGLVVVDVDSIHAGEEISNKNKLSLNLIKLKSGVDNKIGDIISTTPPMQISQTIQQELDLSSKRIRASLGLMDFDINNSQSGYHEKLRLDREMQNMSLWVSNIDDAISCSAKKIVNLIGEYCTKEGNVLVKFMSDPSLLTGELCAILANMLEDASVKVIESIENDNYQQKLVNDLNILKEITGEKFEINLEDVAKAMNIDESLIQSIKQQKQSDNRGDLIQKEVEVKITKDVATAEKDMALASKARAEANKIEKGEKD